MKVAIVGSSGYISSFLLERFANESGVDGIIKIDKSEDADEYLDLEKPEMFSYDCLESVEYVIFTAAISGPDMCAEEFDYCWNINVTGTKYFIQQALARKCRVLFFSSDAVYGNIFGEIYDENSKTLAKTPYGIMKKNIEDYFKEEENFKAIRLSYVASAKDRFVLYCLDCIRNNKIAEVFHPFYRNCIVVSDVVNVVVWLGKNWDKFYPHVLNVSGDELVSRVRFADELNRLYENRLTYEIIKPEDKFYQNRPEITQMRSLYLYEFEILKHESFTEKIKRELEEIVL